MQDDNDRVDARIRDAQRANIVYKFSDNQVDALRQLFDNPAMEVDQIYFDATSHSIRIQYYEHDYKYGDFNDPRSETLKVKDVQPDPFAGVFKAARKKAIKDMGLENIISK